MNQEYLERLEKLLGTPFSGDLPDNALKVRRNLLFACFLSLFLSIGGVNLHPDSSLFGIKFEDISHEQIFQAFFWLLLYFFAHFSWYTVESFVEWRLRLTGQRVVPFSNARGSIIGNTHSDESTDPAQATLYSWWLTHKENFDNAAKLIKETVEDNEISSKQNAIDLDHNKNSQKLSEKHVNDLRTAGNDLGELLPRLENSLERFDNWFSYSRRLQSLRWLIFDLALPISTALISIALLFPKAFPSFSI
tara:strand:+ start:182 stop:928 length:747 start_codon:yes stop_codon:yes gene_type:complete